MKKKYITPEMNVVLLRQKTMLLVGSVLAIDNDDDILNPHCSCIKIQS